MLVETKDSVPTQLKEPCVNPAHSSEIVAASPEHDLDRFLRDEEMKQNAHITYAVNKDNVYIG